MNRSIFSLPIILAILVLTTKIYAQGSAKERDHIGKIALTAVVPEQIDTAMPLASIYTLESKLRQMANLYGNGAPLTQPRFLLSANTVIIAKDIVQASQPLIALSLEFNLYISDWRKGKRFAITTINIKGVGSTLTKAYNNAINSIKADEPAIQRFVKEGRERIIDYYKSNCKEVIRDAEIVASQDGYEEAMHMLQSVPEECSDCFKDCIQKTKEIYNMFILKDCKARVLKARVKWAASPDERGADSVAVILGGINPDMDSHPCYAEAKKLTEEVSRVMKQRYNMDWQLKMKVESSTRKSIQTYNLKITDSTNVKGSYKKDGDE